MTPPTLLDFIDASPSPHHAVATTARILERSGFTELHEAEPWELSVGGWYVRRAGSLVAWTLHAHHRSTSGYRMVGAHTDSPNLRLKPRPDSSTAGYRQVEVEVYGGVLLNSWLDRDLGISGRLTVRSDDSPGGVVSELVRIDRPVARIPQLAIHLDREIGERGLKLDRQQHLAPVWALTSPEGPAGENDFLGAVCAETGVERDRVLSWELMFHDLTPAQYLGFTDEFIAAPRIDNLLSCHAGVVALLAVDDPVNVPLLCLFDHEEVGSVSATGAGSTLLPDVLDRIAIGLGADADEAQVARARSVCVSADGAHATHPNYPERHEPNHHIELNGGPVVKLNANERYATTSDTSARFQLACEAAGVPYQMFVSRTDLACGSTIGPVTAAQLGIATVDAGVAQLSMHSARELTGAADPARFAAALTAFLASD